VKHSHSAPEDFLPLKPVDFHVLMVLLDGKRHGYGIVQDISDRTEGRIKLVPGNFYAMLNRLIDVGLIAETARPATKDSDGIRRRYYRITPMGKRVAAAEAHRLKALVEEAVARKLLRDFA
jgi:DNA-binding PadR family transcriptional regulator